MLCRFLSPLISRKVLLKLNDCCIFIDVFDCCIFCNSRICRTFFEVLSVNKQSQGRTFLLEILSNLIVHQNETHRCFASVTVLPANQSHNICCVLISKLELLGCLLKNSRM